MATDTRKAELLITAQNLSAKPLKDVAKAVEELNSLIEQQSEAAKRGEISFGELAATQKRLGEASKALQSNILPLIRTYESAVAKQQQMVESLAAAQKKHEAYAKTLADSGEKSKSAARELDKLANAVSRAQNKLDAQSNTVGRLAGDLERLGVNTADMASSEQLLLQTSEQLGKALATAEQATFDFARQQRERKKAEDDLRQSVRAQEEAERQRIAALDAAEKQQRELAAAEEARRAKAAKDAATLVEFQKQAAAADQLVKQLDAANAASSRTNQTLVSTAKNLREIVDPAGEARKTVAGVEQQVRELAGAISGIKGPVSNYREQMQQLASAQKAVVAQGQTIDAFRKQVEAVRAARVAYSEARAEVNRYAAQIRAAGAPSAEMAANLNRAKTAAASASQSLQQQISVARQMQTELRAAGVSTNDLAASEKRLADTAKLATSSMQQLTAAYDKNGAAADSVRARNPFGDEGRTTLSLAQRIRGEVLALAAAYIGLQGAIEGARQSIAAVKSEQQIQSKLLVLNDGDTRKVADSYQYMREQAQRLGEYFPEFAKNFTSFAIAVKQSGKISERDTRYIFERVSELGKVLRLSNDDMRGVFTAMQQIASKGQVMSEELKGQIGERLPGAVALAAKEFGMSTEKFTKELENGRIKAEEGLLAIGRAAEKLSKAGLDGALKGIQAQENRFQTALYDFQNLIAKSGFEDAYGRLLARLTDFFKSNEGEEFAKKIGEAFSKVADFLILIVDNLDLVIAATKIWLAVLAGKELAMFGTYLAAMPAQLAAVNSGFASATVGAKAFYGVLGTLTAFIVGWEIGTILSEKFESVRKFGVLLAGHMNTLWILITTGGELAFEAIVQGAKEMGAAVVNAMTKMARESLLQIAKLADALGQGDFAKRINGFVNSITLTASTEGRKRVTDLAAQLKSELINNIKIGKELWDEAGRQQNVINTKPGAGKTTESNPNAPLLLGDDDKGAKAAAEKYKNLMESLTQQVVNIEEQAAKKTAQTKQETIDAIAKQYEDLGRKIRESLKAADAEPLLQRMAVAIKAMQDEAARRWDEEQRKKLQSIEQAFGEMDKKLGKKNGNLEQRLAGVAEGMVPIYETINSLDEEYRSGLTEKAKLYEQELVALATREHYEQQIKDNATEMNNVLVEREAKIKTINDMVVAGLMTEKEGRDAINKLVAESQPQIEKMAQDGITFAESLRGLVSDDIIDAHIAKLQLASASYAKLTQEVYSLAQAQKDVSQLGTDAMKSMADNIAQAAMGMQSWGDAIRNTGQAFLQYAANFLMKIAEMIAQQAILNALQQSAQNGGGGVSGFIYNAIKGLQLHSGGVVGMGGGTPRTASASWFANAPRYHTGGIAGLAPDEYPAILKKGEEVLTQGDPRNILNAGASGGAPVVQDVKVINAIDSGSFVSEGLSSAEGTRAVFNFMRANRAQLKGILG